jgi:hypothetical protein
LRRELHQSSATPAATEAGQLPLLEKSTIAVIVGAGDDFSSWRNSDYARPACRAIDPVDPAPRPPRLGGHGFMSTVDLILRLHYHFNRVLRDGF